MSADGERFRRLIASAYFRNLLGHETVVDLLGQQGAHRLGLLEDDLEEEQLDLPEPDRKVDVYDGETQTVDQ